ncbi:MAG: hypothetical protein U0524_00190 [Candidatus Saccharimonadales bacterium]
MYTEKLLTPHPNKLQDGQEAAPLHEVVDYDQIQQYLGHVALRDDGTELRQAQIQSAEEIASHVGKALWFPERRSKSGSNDFIDMQLDDSLPLRYVAEKQVADCFGYSIATSECLEKAGIDHWIGFANGHATVVMPNTANNGLYLLDALTPALNQDMRGASGIAPSGVEKQIEQFNRGATWLNTRQVAVSSKQDTLEAFEKNPWLTFSKSASSISSDHRGADKRVIMSIFEPQTGRQALEAYKDFDAYIGMDEYEQAADVLSKIPGLFPEIDLRRPQRDIRRLAGGLSGEGRTEKAKQAVASYFSSFILSNDSRVWQAKGDCLRRIAKYGHDESAAKAAIEAYEKASRMPKSHHKTIAGKQKKAQELLGALQSA